MKRATHTLNLFVRRSSSLPIVKSQPTSTRYLSWPIRVSVLLTRFPRISSEVSDLQERFQIYRNEMEIEKSKLADHELALKQKSSAKNIVTARDFEIAQKQKFDIFKPASRTTDEENDPKSLNKKLSQKLVLAIKDETCSEKQYILPSTNLQEGES
ncbi:large ribosomal subunit protein mL46-like [Symsagittifera roscoffensis]|uniref:large ribosomal subunit protein mL46-like n=1 Tax=Symsagittifera roscoffensis TaxID=84072 RepID=UPI00307C3182